MRKSIFELNPDDLLDKENLSALKVKLSEKLEIRRQLRENKQHQEIFDPTKPQRKTNV